MWSISKTRTSNTSSSEDIDVTPMLDVVFIMLIFFIVTASFVKESGLSLNKPDPHHNSSPEQSIVLEVSAIDEISIQKQIVAASSITSTVVRLKAETPDANVVVRVHPKSSTRAMIVAVDQLRAAKIYSPSVSLSGS